MTWTLFLPTRKAISIRHEGGQVTTALPGRDTEARLPVKVGLKSGDDLAPRDLRLLQGSAARIVDERGAFFRGIVDDSEIDEGILVLRGHWTADAKAHPDGRGRMEVCDYRVRDLGRVEAGLRAVGGTVPITNRWDKFQISSPQIATVPSTVYTTADYGELSIDATPGALYRGGTITFRHRVSSVGFTFYSYAGGTYTSRAGITVPGGSEATTTVTLSDWSAERFLWLWGGVAFTEDATADFIRVDGIDLRGFPTLVASTLKSKDILAHAAALLCPGWSTDTTQIYDPADDVYEAALGLTDLEGVVAAINERWGYDTWLDTAADGLPRLNWQPFTFTTANTWQARRRDGAEVQTGGPSLEGLASDCWVTYTDPADGRQKRIRRTATTSPVSGRRIDMAIDAGAVTLAVAQALGDAALAQNSVLAATGTVRVPYGALRDPAGRVSPGWWLRAPAGIRVDDAVPLDLALSADLRDAVTTFKVSATTAYQDGTIDVTLDNSTSTFDLLARRVAAAVARVPTS